MHLYAGQIGGVYIYADSSSGILFEDNSSGYTADNEALTITRGCAMTPVLFGSQKNHGEYEFVGSIGYLTGVPAEGRVLPLEAHLKTLLFVYHIQ